jgi:hypothetical protein
MRHDEPFARDENEIQSQEGKGKNQFQSDALHDPTLIQSPNEPAATVPPHQTRRGKPPSAKTLAIRRVIEELGGPDAAEIQQVISRVREQDNIEVVGNEVSVQKATLKRQAEETVPTIPPRSPVDSGGDSARMCGMLSAQEIRDFTALVKRIGIENLRALLEMAEAMR